jgi:8-oxo-dGTP diphosphatase
MNSLSPGSTRLQPPQARFAINVVENADGEILLLKRRANARLGAGRWGFSAGHIEDGETPQDCAMRELREELGPDCQVSLIHSLGPIRDSLYGGVYEIHLFHLRWRGGTISLNSEHTEYAWVSRGEYRNYRVVDGVDEDLYFLNVWPRAALNERVLDEALARRRAAGEEWG